MAEAKDAAEKTASAAKKTASKAKETAKMNGYAFAEAGQTAFKETFERSAATFGEMSEYSKENLDAMIASMTAATQGVEEMNSNAVSYAKKSMEDGMSAAKTMASVKSVQEAIELQADFAKSALDSYLAEVNKTADLMSSVVKDAWKPINDRAVAAMDQIQTVR